MAKFSLNFVKSRKKRKMMNLGKFYAVIARIFALNFALPPSAKLFSELNKNPKWIITNDSEANAKGRELYEESLKTENTLEIAKDFANLKKYFNAEFFFEGDKARLEGFYKKCKFSPNLNVSALDSLTNELSFFSWIVELKQDELTKEILGVLLSSYLLPYAKKLAPVLQNEAKSKFYRAMGYLFEDFASGIENTLKVRVVPR